MGQSQTCTPEFKREAVQLLEDGNPPTPQIPCELDTKGKEGKGVEFGGVDAPDLGSTLQGLVFFIFHHRTTLHDRREVQKNILRDHWGMIPCIVPLTPIFHFWRKTRVNT